MFTATRTTGASRRITVVKCESTYAARLGTSANKRMCPCLSGLMCLLLLWSPLAWR
ncbi:hypothetical protein HDE80_003554 [Rhodanobacter sp. A1T4]|nr:hypothetical protein [Rhodanobacter sp. A1T4]